VSDNPTWRLFSADLVLTPGQPARAGLGILCRGDTIDAVGPLEALRERAREHLATEVALSGRALVPGTVNAHNHSFQSLLRGIGDDLPFLEWRDKALYRYAPRLGTEGVHTGALLAFGEMLLHGVTTVCDFFYVQDGANDNARAVLRAGPELGIRTVLGRTFYDWDGAPPSFRETPTEARTRFDELVRETRTKGDGLQSVLAAPHSLHGASAEMIRTAVECAAEAETPLHMHLAEEKYQVAQAVEKYGKTPLRALDALGALGPRLVLIHGCWLDEGERALLGERGGGLAYCPGSNMFLGDGVTDIVDLHRRGVRIGLGTDGGCSNSRVSVFDEMRSCALLQKVHRIDGGAIDAESCFAMGTAGGGAILGLPVGRLEPGFRADLCALDLDDPSLWPRQALHKNVVYSLSARAVTDVFVAGEPVVRARSLVRVPLSDIQARVDALTGMWGTWGTRGKDS
jgi:5-methylthioadenosine/S-adenosylhomocysteine deaminase